MNSIFISHFRDEIKKFIKKVVKKHEPLKVTCPNGDNFVVISAEDWEREQETLYVLQNSSLMQQIVESAATHAKEAAHISNSVEIEQPN